MSFLLTNMFGTVLSAVMVLSVLKTIGLVALIVICVFAVIAACVMFVPIRYHARGDIDEMNFDIRLHWFLKIIMFRFVYKDGSGDYALYLFGIRTRFLDKDFLDKWKKWREKRKAKKAKKAYKSRRKKYEKEHNKYKEQYLKEQSIESDSSEKFSMEETTNSSVQDKFDSDNKDKPRNQVLTIVKKILHTLQVVRDYQPLQMIWSDIVRFLHRGRPRKINADIVFGFEDPATTGQVLGIISNIYYIYQYEDLLVNGDFEATESYIKGDFDVRGYIQSVFGLVFILRVIKKKRFRKFLKALKL